MNKNSLIMIGVIVIVVAMIAAVAREWVYNNTKRRVEEIIAMSPKSPLIAEDFNAEFYSLQLKSEMKGCPYALLYTFVNGELFNLRKVFDNVRQAVDEAARCGR